MKPSTCPRSWEVRAADEGRLSPADVDALARHARTCASCSAELAALDALRSLLGELPEPRPTELSLRRARGRLLRDAMALSGSAPRGRAWLAVAAFGVLLALVGVVRLGVDRALHRFAGTVVSTPVAAWSQTRNDSVERVVLTDGDVRIHVRKQGAKERFVVLVPDGEVEVRGTTFDVSVHGQRTTRVHVDEGTVVVRIGRETILERGENWSPIAPPPPQEPEAPPPIAIVIPSASTASPPAPSEPRRSPVALPKPTPSAAASAAVAPASGDRELDEYTAAVEAYRAGDFAGAVTQLEAFAIDHPDSAFADDASFLEASSLAATGRTDAAALLAERHLARFPSSFHRKEAAILVARLRRDRGDCDGVREVMKPWLGEAATDPRVSAAVGGCVAR